MLLCAQSEISNLLKKHEKAEKKNIYKSEQVIQLKYNLIFLIE